MECDKDEDTSHIRVLPDACVEIFLNYTNSPVAIIDDQLYKRSIASFRMNQYVDVQMRKGSGCVAVCFYPGMAHRFFKYPMDVLANTTTPLNDLWGFAIEELEAQLAECSSPVLKVNILQQFLLQQLMSSKEDPVISQCIKQVRYSNGDLSVAELNNKVGLSQRQLSRKFQQIVGLSPKEYLRVNRFIYSLQQLKEHANSSLTEVAYLSGYYDQAHFIRDYKDFTGCTPGALVRSDHILY